LSPAALINLPILYRNAKNPALLRRLARLTAIVSAAGIAVLVLQEYAWKIRP
jgi:hypothetical protein